MKKKLLFGFLMVLVSVLTLTMIGCGGKISDAVDNLTKTPSPVDANTIAYDGSVFTWEAAKNAASYNVTVNEKVNGKVTTGRYSYTAKNTDTEITISIVSVNEDKQADAVQKTFTRLETITQIDFDDNGVMTWPSVDGADNYIVEVNGKQTTTDYTSFEQFELGKTNTIRIRPVASDGSSFSSFSNSIQKTYLASPSNIKFDGQIISWNGSSYGTGYEVYVNGALVGETKTSNLQYDAQGESIAIQVKALGDGANHNIFSSPVSDEVRYVYLPTIQEIRVNAGVLEWDAIPEATGYEIRLNSNRKVEVNTNSYELTPGTSYTIEIKPTINLADTNCFSEFSAPKTVFILRAPETLWNDSYDLSDGEARNNLYWSKNSDNVIGWSVKLTFNDGTGDKPISIADLGPNDINFAYGYNQVGTYTVQIKANADTTSGTYYDSPWSKPIKVIRLAAPKQLSSNFVVSSPDNLLAGFTVNFGSVSGASGYKLFKEGTEVEGATSKTNSITVNKVIENEITEAQEITYGVQSLGTGLQTLNGERFVTISSLLEQNLTFKITVLAVPKNINFGGFNATWDSVVGASGYAVKLGSVQSTQQATYPLQNLESGTFMFSVCAKGNGGQTLASPFTEEYTLIRLENPTGIRIGTTDNENQITWEPVLHAKSYEIYFNGSQSPVAVNSNDSITEYITSRGVTIDLIAVANEFDSDNNKTYYISSPHMSTPFNIIKLNAPTFGDKLVENGYLVWNPSSNIDAAVYTPSYRIYDEEGYAYNGFYQASQFSIENCTAGAFNTVSIKAIGDGVHYMNSDMSDAKQFYLLATPEVKREGSSYTWDMVAQSTSYNVYIEGELVKTLTHVSGQPSYEYKVDLSKFPSTNKEYKIEVIANGDGGYQVVASKPGTFMQKVQMASTPSITVSYSDPQYSLTGEITVNITTPSNYTTGYRYTVGGASSNEETALQYKYCPNAVGKYDVLVYALGGVFDEEGTLYIASDRDTKSITLLAAPSNIDVTRDGVVSWTHTDASRSGFSYIVYYNDSTTEEGTCKNAGFTLKNFANVSKIEIKAVGNGTTVIDSQYTTWIKK